MLVSRRAEADAAITQIFFRKCKYSSDYLSYAMTQIAASWNELETRNWPKNWQLCAHASPEV